MPILGQLSAVKIPPLKDVSQSPRWKPTSDNAIGDTNRYLSATITGMKMGRIMLVKVDHDCDAQKAADRWHS
jgi:hypothetical protein